MTNTTNPFGKIRWTSNLRDLVQAQRRSLEQSNRLLSATCDVQSARSESFAQLPRELSRLGMSSLLAKFAGEVSDYRCHDVYAFWKAGVDRWLRHILASFSEEDRTRLRDKAQVMRDAGNFSVRTFLTCIFLNETWIREDLMDAPTSSLREPSFLGGAALLRASANAHLPKFFGALSRSDLLLLNVSFFQASHSLGEESSILLAAESGPELAVLWLDYRKQRPRNFFKSGDDLGLLRHLEDGERLGRVVSRAQDVSVREAPSCSEPIWPDGDAAPFYSQDELEEIEYWILRPDYGEEIFEPGIARVLEGDKLIEQQRRTLGWKWMHELERLIEHGKVRPEVLELSFFDISHSTLREAASALWNDVSWARAALARGIAKSPLAVLADRDD